MKRNLGILLSAILLTGSMFFGGCATDRVVLLESKPLPDSPTVEEQVTRLYSADPGLKKFRILVNAFQGIVMLDGVVDTEAQRQQATKLAWTLWGVRGVENNLFLPGEKQL